MAGLRVREELADSAHAKSTADLCAADQELQLMRTARHSLRARCLNRT